MDYVGQAGLKSNLAPATFDTQLGLSLSHTSTILNTHRPQTALQLHTHSHAKH